MLSCSQAWKMIRSFRQSKYLMSKEETNDMIFSRGGFNSVQKVRMSRRWTGSCLFPWCTGSLAAPMREASFHSWSFLAFFPLSQDWAKVVELLGMKKQGWKKGEVEHWQLSSATRVTAKHQITWDVSIWMRIGGLLKGFLLYAYF